MDGDRRGPAAQPGREGPSPRDPGTDGGHRGAKGRSRRRDLTARAGHFEGMRNMSEPIIICGDGRISRTGLEDRSRRAAGLFAAARSEEHTSELQSLMRISYAVFCSKKTHTKP